MISEHCHASESFPEVDLHPGMHYGITRICGNLVGWICLHRAYVLGIPTIQHSSYTGFVSYMMSNPSFSNESA